MDGERIGAICVALFMILVGAASLLIAVNPRVRKSLAEITQLDTGNKPVYLVRYVIVGVLGLICGLATLMIIFLN
jgi:hypothetical protein